ncbi:cysteine desulfurase family protein [Enteractinococcus coprophilus]|uniref:cysteine desulfurase n=1 Tax=Enteractinococcus coprophilus TaxID=1027633 RepID=A0A543AFB0_9MICC|nr:cysteine desulfurase family protein [Enteractinococcus coprophilus]TQL71259.1 cysteine desulfurase [Enteractinococcus coprophilus]
MLYLDAAATAPLRPEARQAMLTVLDGGPGNASAVHTPGKTAKATLTHARQQVADALGARTSQVVFTAGGTEANNLALKGVAVANPRGKHIVTTAIEHSSIRKSCEFLARIGGFEVTEIGVDSMGRVDEEAAIAAIRPDTTLVSIGLANGEIGTVQSLERIAEAARAAGALVHTDAVQAAASLPVSFAPGQWPGAAVDAMSIASHKFGGPQGAGALLIRSGIELEPLLHGGGQEAGHRAGTENLAAIAGFGVAVAAVMPMAGTRAQAMMAQRDAFVQRIVDQIPGAKLTGHPTERIPNHASFVIKGFSGESMLVDLDVAGVAASSGSACSAGKKAPSGILLAMGYDPDVAVTALRFTFPDPLTDEAFDQLVGTTLRVLGQHAAATR